MGSDLTEFRRLSGVGPSLMEASAGLAPEMLDKLSIAFGTKVTEQDVRFLRFRKYRTGVELEDEAERLGGILTSVEDTEVDPEQLVAFLKKHRAKPMPKTEATLGPVAFMALGAQAGAEDELGREVIKAFRKNIKLWTDYLDQMTGSRWAADLGELTVDFNETFGKKRSIGIYWDIDVGNNKATFYVEGPRGTGTKTFPRKALIEPVKPGAPAAFFSWLERSLREALEGFGEAFEPGEQRAISEESVGKTIFQQLGGNRIMVMLGKQAKALIIKNGLGLKWPAKEKSKGNYVQITLRDDDTYDMEFSWVSKDGSKKVTKTFEGIGAEGLRRSFESWTGWRLGMSEENGAPVVDERLALKGWTELTVWGRDRSRDVWRAIQDVTKETKDKVVKKLRKDPGVLKKYTHLFVSEKKPSFSMRPSEFPPGVVVVGFEPVYESDDPGSSDKFKTGHGKLDSVVRWLLGKSKRTEYDDGSVLFHFQGRLPLQMALTIFDAANKKVLTVDATRQEDRYLWEKGAIGFNFLTGTTKQTMTNIRFSAHDETVPASTQTEGATFVHPKKGLLTR
jgi:hypothetical protein